jgi:Regulator of chromosome condensation (RCC1) repeat
VQPDVEAKVRKLSERPRSPAIFKLEPILPPLGERSWGQLFTVGDNMTGQLGFSTDDIESKKRPALVEGLAEIVLIVCGGMHTVCLNKSGEVQTISCLFIEFPNILRRKY